MQTQEKSRRKTLLTPPSQPHPAWHDPEELRDRLNQPKVTLEEMRLQAQRMMSQPQSETTERLKKKKC